MSSKCRTKSQYQLLCSDPFDTHRKPLDIKYSFVTTGYLSVDKLSGLPG